MTTTVNNQVTSFSGTNGNKMMTQFVHSPSQFLTQTDMKSSGTSVFSLTFLAFIFFFFFLLPSLGSADQTEDSIFLQCLSVELDRDPDDAVSSRVIHSRNNASFFPILYSSVQNPRFSVPETPKPLAIVTPLRVSHVQSAVKCARRHGVSIRTRSGGHDYEGLSYVARNGVPFVIIDLRNLRSVTVDAGNRTAWVQAGATIGELYYAIGKTSETLAFPAGVCPTVGVGGHFSGGGYGTLLRKHGLAADNIIDAFVIDARGRFLDRKSMGEDFFWAIRAGGGSSFGIIVAWKVKLVSVPPIVTVFSVTKTLKQNAAGIIHRWQHIVDKLPQDLFIRVMLERTKTGPDRSVQATFPSIYLGTVDKLIALMGNKFPELGLKPEDCIEMSWIRSVLWFAEFPLDVPISVLANRTRTELSFKAKSDFVQTPIPKSAILEMWKRLNDDPEAEFAQLIFTPFGGKMSQISESSIPFPHRAGNIYEIQYLVYWHLQNDGESGKYVEWVRNLYRFATPFVSKSPRGAYINLRDLDLGRNYGGSSSYKEAKSWGEKYFKGNFERLVRVKSIVDRRDFFRDEQSIPSLSYSYDDV